MQVGAELENPFGTDDNDFPLLHMGLALVDNMDSMLRTMHNRHQAKRMKTESMHAPPSVPHPLTTQVYCTHSLGT